MVPRTVSHAAKVHISMEVEGQLRVTIITWTVNLDTEDEIDERNKKGFVSSPTEVIWHFSGSDGDTLEHVAGSNQV
jgi:hypothetical protein